MNYTAVFLSTLPVSKPARMEDGGLNLRQIALSYGMHGAPWQKTASKRALIDAILKRQNLGMSVAACTEDYWTAQAGVDAGHGGDAAQSEATKAIASARVQTATEKEAGADKIGAAIAAAIAAAVGNVVTADTVRAIVAEEMAKVGAGTDEARVTEIASAVLTSAADEIRDGVNDVIRRGGAELRDGIAKAFEGRFAKFEGEAAKMAATIAEITKPRTVTVDVPSIERKTEVKFAHRDFEKVLFLSVTCRKNVYIHGPAGTGKSWVAKQIAEILDRAFLPLSLGPQTTQSYLYGGIDGNGNYVATEFRRMWENGGVILLDEADRCNPRVLVTLNAPLASNLCAFPDRVVPKHPDTIIIATGNTLGMGADQRFTSAQQQDRSTWTRLAKVFFDYDRDLERGIAESVAGTEIAKAWTEFVWKVRDVVKELHLRYEISPRAVYDGADVMAKGGARAMAEEAYVFGDMSGEDATRVRAALAKK